jgi:hypothetical protein
MIYQARKPSFLKALWAAFNERERPKVITLNMRA